MNLFSRVVIGYHGCPADRTESLGFLEQLLAGTESVANWRASENEYDWLGRGVYFWEYGPERARQWAGADGVVIGAIIQLGRCFDLTESASVELLTHAFDSLSESYVSQGMPLPNNTRGKGLKRDLDCLVVNHAILEADSIGKEKNQGNAQTVRCPFEEGEPAFPGSMIRKQTHIQVAVRNLECIVGVFRPSQTHVAS